MRGVIWEVYPAVVSVFPTTEGYTSSCKDKASQKLRMDPNRNFLQLPKETNKNGDDSGAWTQPTKGSSRRKAEMKRKQRGETKRWEIENTNNSNKNNKSSTSCCCCSAANSGFCFYDSSCLKRLQTPFFSPSYWCFLLLEQRTRVECCSCTVALSRTGRLIGTEWRVLARSLHAGVTLWEEEEEEEERIGGRERAAVWDLIWRRNCRIL